MTGLGQDGIDVNGAAVIGMAGRFPGARNIEEFWHNLCAGVETIKRFSEDELDPSIDPGLISDPNYIKARGILQDADKFDASFFGIYPREAEIMDPQQRVFLEAAWEAIEDAGYDSGSFDGLIGVFGGAGFNTYLINNVLPNQGLSGSVGEHQASLANAPDYLATRVSYKLDLRGPSVSLYTGCSSSLVAASYAFDSLLSYQCDIALAGGVFVWCPQNSGYLYQEGEIFSADGRCRPFDAQARGTVFSNGVGIVVLKRLEEALKDKDHIYAVIRGTAVNNDGSKKMSFAAPSVEGQAEVIAMAMANAGVSPETITFIEAHGTGTILGDPIEIEALNQAFQGKTSVRNFCALGSLKGNVGHLDAAAGVAGLIKASLALKHEVIPPNPNFDEANPQIDFENSPFYVNKELIQWRKESTPRRAGVSSLGVGGTNVHVVLEEAPRNEISGPSRPLQLLLCSAKTESTLHAATGNLCEYLKGNPAANMADVAYTLQTGRKAFSHRRFTVCRDAADAESKLKALDPQHVKTARTEAKDPEVVFMFPGQGAQYVNMGLNLYEHERLFRETVDQCAEVLKPLLGRDLLEILYPKGGDLEAAAELLRETRFQQPAIFTIEYALAKLWETWGVRPAAMIGHSIGEYVAACLAGVFSLEDALMLVATRGRMMQELPGGSMLSIRLPVTEVEPKLDGGLSLAAMNAPSLCVVSGPTEAVQLLQEGLEREGVVCRFLHTSHAFHSPVMDSIVEPFSDQTKCVQLSAPRIPFISGVTGTWIAASEATDPIHWGKQLRLPVRFAEGIKTLWEREQRVLLEVGPRMTCSTLARQQARDISHQRVIASLGDTAQDAAEWAALLNAIGQLWLAGVSIDWENFYEGEQRYRVPLPTYPFERQRHWIEASTWEAVAARGMDKEEYLAREAKEDKDLALSDLPKPEINNLALELKKDLEGSSGRDLSGLTESMTFVEMGFDSLFLTQWSFLLKKKLGIQIPVYDLFDDLSTIESLATYIRQELPSFGAPSSPGVETPITKEIVPEAPKPLQAPMETISPQRMASQLDPELTERFIAKQLQIISQQLELLRASGSNVTLRNLVESVESTPSVVGQKRIEPADEDLGVSEGRTLESAAEATIRAIAKGTGIQRVSREIDHPLSFAQQRLWYLDQLVPGLPIYNLPSAFRLIGKLDVSILEEALNEIIRRHEALRTTVGIQDDLPVQKIAASLKLQVPQIDLKSLPIAAREEKLAEILREESLKPYNLSDGPLVRALLIRINEEEHVLFFMANHCVFDGWSEDIFQRELVAIYEALSTGRDSALEELPVQYVDFAVWQQDLLRGEEFERQLEYWRAQLSGDLQVLEVPTDFPRPAEQSFEGAREVLHIPKTVIESLASLGRSEGATLFMVLVAAYKCLLHRYAGQEDITVGTAIANRTLPEMEGIIGFFANTLVLRSNVQGDLSFRAFLRQVRQVCTGAYAHQDFPFERLVQELNPERDLSRTPLYQTLFAIAPGIRKQEMKMGNLMLRNQKVPFSAAMTDLSFWMSLRPDGLGGEVEYCTALFTADTIRRLVKNFEVLLRAVGQDADVKIAELPLLSERETQQVLVDWNRTEIEYPADTTIDGIIALQAARVPEKVAVAGENESLTYKDLNFKANQMAHFLTKLGVEREVLVGLFVERQVDMFVGILGILKAGGAYVPLDPEYPKERLAYMMKDSDLKVVLTHETLKSELPDTEAQIVCLDADWPQISKEPNANLSGKAGPDNLAYVIYTSGSTGKPKGVEVLHKGLVNLVTSMSREPGISEEDVVMALTTISFDMSIPELFLPFAVGARTALLDRETASDGQALWKAIEHHGVTFMQGTPTTWRLLLAAGWQGSDALNIVVGGEAVPRDLVTELVPRVHSVWNMYGPTETTVWSACCRLSDSQGPVIVGKPMANTTIYLLDGHTQLVPIGVPGEVYIGGIGVTRGYKNRPELTAKSFIPDPFSKTHGARLYKTGDLARYHEDGNLEYLNRIDNQVKVRGFRIELGEIESVLSASGAVKQAVVVVKEVKLGDARLVAFIIGKPGETATPTELRRHLREKLPEYMIPQHFVEVDDLPTTPSGKIDRKKLAAEFKFGDVAEDLYVAPRSETERYIASIWGEALGVDRIGSRDNFFEIGGHSLLAMQVISRIRRETGVELSPRVMLLNSLGQIAAEYPLTLSGKNGSIDEAKLPSGDASSKITILDKVKRKFSRGLR